MGGVSVTRLSWVFALPALLPTTASGQTGLVVSVVAQDTRTPLHGAVVRATRSGRSERTDRVGHARFQALVRPETLVVAAIGFRSDTVIVSETVLAVEAHLVRQPVTLAELSVIGRSPVALTPTVIGEWTMPGELLRAMPAAVEHDVFRALSLVPAVSFSTPLSARPIIRGYDAAESVVRIDGFEILNPYHIGKIFSSFPIDATESVSVAPLPASPTDGGTLAGVVDVRGRRSGDETGAVGGVDLTLASATGWLGIQTPIQAFVAARAGFLEVATGLLSGEAFQYNFHDAYAHGRVPLGRRRSWETTVYASRDDLGEVGLGAGTEWSSALLGNRVRLLDGSRGSLDVVGSLNLFTLTGLRVRARNSQIDVENRFGRTTFGLRAAIAAGTVQLEAGSALSVRRMSHDLAVRYGDDFAATARESRVAEWEASLGAQWVARPIAVTLGVRTDASRAAIAWQPRMRMSVVLGGGFTGSVSAARAMRLYQVITDPQPEPTVTAFDFWYGAGEDGIPVPRVDHLSANAGGTWDTWSAHASAFLSFGEGLGELRPAWDQRTGVGPLRFGRSRTRGIELRLAWMRRAPGAPAAALTYVLSRSERQWDTLAWTPWRLDRLHTLRLQVQLPVAGRWKLFGSGEVVSGQPVTPVDEVVWVEQPVPSSTTPTRGRLRYRYGREGAGRSAGTFHVDVGGHLAIRGPWGSRVRIGLSVINLAVGPVAPEVPVEPFELFNRDGSYSDEGVRYERLFTLPPVPSVSVRIEF